MMRAIILFLALAGCTTVAGSRVVCPPLKEYSPALQTHLAAELENMAAQNLYPVSRMFIRDYIGLRDAVRACAAQ